MDLPALSCFNLHELSYFIEFAEECNFARAAKRFGIDRSSLRAAIKKLEKRLKADLCTRTSHGFQLTMAGVAFREDARKLLNGFDDAVENVAVIAAGYKGRLRIAQTDGPPVQRVMHLFQESERENPEVKLAIRERSVVEQIRELRLGLLDLGVVTSVASDLLAKDHDLQAIPLHRQPIVIVTNRLMRQHRVHVLEAGMGPYLLVGDVSMGAGDIGKLIEPSSAATESIQFVSSLDLLITLVLLGRGTGLVGAEQAKAYGTTGLVVRPLAVKEVCMTAYLVKRRKDESPLLTRFVEKARRVGLNASR